MRRSHLSPTLSIRATLVFLALVVSAMALVILGTKPAESQQAPTQPLYEVHDLGELPGGPFSYAFGINEAGKVVGAASVNFTPELGADEHPFLYSDGVMQDLGTLGGRYAYADDINDADKVVGTSSTNPESFESHAFLYSGGKMQDLGTLQGYPDSFARAINNKDQVVGHSFSGELGDRAFLYSDGVMQDLGTLGGTTSSAFGINEAGKVVGEAATNPESFESHAFLYSGGQMQDLGTLGGSFSRAYDINEADKVVGSSTTSGDAEQHTFLYSDGKMQDLGTLEEPYNGPSYPTALNNADQVVGQAVHSVEGTEHPFLYSDGVMRDLNSLIPANSGWELANVEDINDNGYIVGKGINKDGREHAVLLTPVTAPYVTDTSPNDGDSKVSRTTKVTASFSEEVQPATLTSANVQLFSGKSKMPVKATLSKTSTSVTLTPSSKLDANTIYRTVVGTGVKDLADNALDQDQISSNGNQPKQWTFTTGPK